MVVECSAVVEMQIFEPQERVEMEEEVVRVMRVEEGCWCCWWLGLREGWGAHWDRFWRGLQSPTQLHPPSALMFHRRPRNSWPPHSKLRSSVVGWALDYRCTQLLRSEQWWPLRDRRSWAACRILCCSGLWCPYPGAHQSMPPGCTPPELCMPPGVPCCSVNLTEV